MLQSEIPLQWCNTIKLPSLVIIISILLHKINNSECEEKQKYISFGVLIF